MAKLQTKTQATSWQPDDILYLVRDKTTTPLDRYIKVSDAVRTYLCNGRLTLTTATPVTTSDVTAAGTLYFTPYKGDVISLYYNSEWVDYRFTEKSLALTLTSGSVYDIFAYYSGSAVTLESLVWTSATARATALTTQNGVLVKTGATDRRYLGTLCASATDATEDSESKRYLYNHYNRVARKLKCIDATNSWAYTTTSFREIQAGSTFGTSRVGLVNGWAEDSVIARATLAGTSSSGNPTVAVGIGLDSATNVADTNEVRTLGTGINSFSAFYSAIIPVGLHYIAWLEYGGANVTMYGDNGASVFQTGMTVTAWM